jgi:hypothetical protein
MRQRNLLSKMYSHHLSIWRRAVSNCSKSNPRHPMSDLFMLPPTVRSAKAFKTQNPATKTKTKKWVATNYPRLNPNELRATTPAV